MTGQCIQRAIFQCVFLLCAMLSRAQDVIPPEPQVTMGIRTLAEVVDGDTIPLIQLNTVNVYTQYVFKTPKQREEWSRVKYNVRKVYPYAILAAAKLKEYDLALSKIENENLRKAFIKACEKDLRRQFEEDLKGLTVSQGRVLMKLIDRETGRTTYELVKELRGSFQAAMWQTVATLFGNNMKIAYDPLHEDIMIERAIKLVEAGQF